MKFLEAFFGGKHPYDRTPTFKYWPDILTIRWWRWCLAHGWGGLARERIRVYYVRKVKYRYLQWPICWVTGHMKYKISDWGSHGVRCSRCHRWLEYHSHSK